MLSFKTCVATTAIETITWRTFAGARAYGKVPSSKSADSKAFGLGERGGCPSSDSTTTVAGTVAVRMILRYRKNRNLFVPLLLRRANARHARLTLQCYLLVQTPDCLVYFIVSDHRALNLALPA